MGTVFNIQKYSIHDGPGIRTTVFLKGCNLRCLWCHNPESFDQNPQIQHFPDRCIGCGACFQLCLEGAHRMTDDGKVFDRDVCKVCGRCVEECYAGSLVIMGEEMSVEEVLTEVEKDRPFYETSGGGVTFSGGEPLLQIEFTAALLKESKRRHLPTAIDSALNVPWETILKVKPHTDLFLIDVKTLDNDLHRKLTGVGNSRVLENLKRLADGNVEIWVRVPVVPDIVNDSESQIEALVDFIGGLEGIEMVELLPYHRLAEAKYRSLGLESTRYETPTAEQMERLKAVLTRNGLPTARQKKTTAKES